ncbi:hypothetical protein GCM10010387_16250 [Streptomyces inusitatus]|uniref:Uncharacterized protein n=1 Tax=Streptomyces inusitatus TaxID=68221 RepID=A0A918UNV8_9ACTN|nr:hypothetical protein [Streptomyces inusitatus]GGZ23771.1 hypothetical protein GCM10010387_16250 [Streptomyces inusitatus]
MTAYLADIRFDPDDHTSYYSVEIDASGPIVYSECCHERMGLTTARLLHEALGRWIADQPGIPAAPTTTDGDTP